MNEYKRNPQDILMSFAHCGGIRFDTKKTNAAQGRMVRRFNKLVSRSVRNQRV